MEDESPMSDYRLQHKTVKCTVVQKQKHLLEAFKKGDKKAFQIIYLQWFEPTWLLLVKLTKSEEDSQDITQDVFRILWETREKIDTSKEIRCYIFTLAKQLAIKLFRRQSVMEKYSNQAEIIMNENIDSSDHIIAKEVELVVRNAISKMPDSRKKVAELSFIKGLTNEDIAKKLGITNRAVATLVYEARRQIKDILSIIAICFVV